MGTLTGSEILAKALKAQGMDTLFFLMGGPMLETESELVRLGIKMIDTHHEQARGDDGARVDARDAEAGRVHGVVGPGDDQPAHRRGQCLGPTRRPLDRHRRVEPARVARHGGVPGDRPGGDVQARHQVGGAHLRRPAHPRDRRDGLPPRDVGPARARCISTSPATSSARRWTRAASRIPSPWRPSPRSLGDPAAVKEAIGLLATRRAAR